VTSARRLWSLSLALALLGVAATVAAGAVAVTRVDFATPSLAEVMAVCQRWVLPQLTTASALVFALGSVSLAAVLLCTRSAARQLLAARRFERRLPVTGNLAGARDVRVIADDAPHAFCVGWRRPRIYLSQGALDMLDEAEVRAVIDHERHHAGRRDPLRLLTARSLGEGLFFIPGLRRLAERYAALAELAADEAAVKAAHGPKPLASALLAFESHPSPVVVGVAPERVDSLLGQRARFELPVLLLVGGAATVGVLVALTVGVAGAAGHATVAFPVLVAQVCMLAMAAAPLLLGATGLLGARRLLSGR
jgi:Zn-dependent protease with chaperone function